jgi:hypothetical protein
MLVGTRYQKKGFALETLDESFLFYDELVRRVWTDEKNRPVVRATGSRKHPVCLEPLPCLQSALQKTRWV